MSKAAWVASTEGEVALASAVAKTILAGKAPSDRSLTIVVWSIGFDGVVAAAAPVLVELMRGTQAGDGTSTSVTPRRKRGPAASAHGSTWGKNFTAEPTVLTLIEDWQPDPYKGVLALQEPLSREIELLPAETFAIRCTAPDAVNARAFAEFEMG
jgi:hypothetical protein